MMMSVQDPLSRKRSLMAANSSDEHINKRIKNNKTDENVERDEEAFSGKMFQAYVESALDSFDKNDDLQVDAIASRVNLPVSHEGSISVSNFTILLKYMISNVFKLDKKAGSKLISAVIDYEWLQVKGTDTGIVSDFIGLYSQFLSVLVSSLPKYVHEVTTKLVAEFSSIDLNENSILVKHHDILHKIMKFIPTSINTLPNILQGNFPHHLSSTAKELTNYVQNLLRVITYCPDLQFTIWQLIVENSIKLDVELQNELDDLDDDEIEDLISRNDDSDDELNSDIDEDVSDDEEGDAENPTQGNDLDDISDMEGEAEYVVDSVSGPSRIKNLITKLDFIIHLLLTETTNYFTSDAMNNGHGITLYNTITSLFKSHILPTHFTKSIQFVLFHVSQMQQELADSFLVTLIDVAFNTKEILEKRLKAMQYLSSYIARAKSLSKHQIVFIVSYLVGWLDKYIKEREYEVLDLETPSLDGENKGGMERFKLFYAAFQALLYIFCFRYKQLYNESSDDSSNKVVDSEWECDLDKFFQRAIITKFNPLKYCDETVVFIFAKIATKLNVCYCYSLIEQNKRERILSSNGPGNNPTFIGNFKQKQEFLDLEAYFPFDPLSLPSSRSVISECYIEWSDVNPNEGDDDDDESTSNSVAGDDDSNDEDDENGPMSDSDDNSSEEIEL